jgi:hypothetical protein
MLAFHKVDDAGDRAQRSCRRGARLARTWLAELAVETSLSACGGELAPMQREALRAGLEKVDGTWMPLIRRLGIKSD